MVFGGVRGGAGDLVAGLAAGTGRERVTSASAVVGRLELDDPAAVERALAAAALRLGTDERRVAASAVQYDAVERLWTVVVAAWRRHAVLLDARQLGVAVDDDGGLTVAVPDRPGHVELGDDPAPLAAARHRDLVLGIVADVHAAFRSRVRVAAGLLWGNAATALTIAVGAPLVAPPLLVEVAEQLLARPPLAGTVTGPARGPVRRHTCCLLYRGAGRRPCGDCPLIDSVVVRRRQAVQHSRHGPASAEDDDAVGAVDDHLAPALARGDQGLSFTEQGAAVRAAPVDDEDRPRPRVVEQLADQADVAVAAHGAHRPVEAAASAEHPQR